MNSEKRRRRKERSNGGSRETDALLSPSVSSTNSTHPTGSTGVSNHASFISSRVMVLLMLVVVVWAGIFFQTQVNHLTGQLQKEQNLVDHLQLVVQANQQVIERFNSSVTNSDVMEHLTTLEGNLSKTSQHLQKRLTDVQEHVQDQLDATILQLSETVTEAESEISEQVEKVKKDVEQYVITTEDQFSMENSFMVYQLAGTFTLLSCLISMWHMTAHIRKMVQPDVQRKILAILWMCPIYAVTSWFSLVFHSAEGYLAIIKDGYEAYIIYQFLSFCIAVLGKGDRNKVVDMLSLRADHLTPPFRLLSVFEICGCCKAPSYENNRALADAILLQCQLFAMQFVFFRPLTTTAMVVLAKMNYYGAGDGPTDYRSPQFYITIIQNLSIFIAFAGLLKFYHAVDKDLAWCRPFAKFLCIKCVVFMTFWQGLAISVLAATTDVGGQDAEEWGQSAQNFLICLEMLLFSIAHFYCFPTEEWEEGYRVKHGEGQFGDSIALGDFFQDVKLILRHGNKKKKKKGQEPAIPEGDEELGEGSSSDDTDGSANTEDTTKNDASDLVQCDSLVEQEHMVAKALEESLGLAGDDPDIVEAKNRLLASNILSPDLFEAASSDDDFSESDIGAFLANSSMASHAEEEEDDDNNKSAEEKVDEEAGEVEHEESPYDALAGIYSNKYYTEEGFQSPNEATSLLSQSSESAQKLRPSIFTQVASLAESDGESEKKAA